MVLNVVVMIFICGRLINGDFFAKFSLRMGKALSISVILVNFSVTPSNAIERSMVLSPVLSKWGNGAEVTFRNYNIIGNFIKTDLKQIYCTYSRTQKIQNGFLQFLLLFLRSTLLLNRNMHIGK